MNSHLNTPGTDGTGTSRGEINWQVFYETIAKELNLNGIINDFEKALKVVSDGFRAYVTYDDELAELRGFDLRWIIKWQARRIAEVVIRNEKQGTLDHSDENRIEQIAEVVQHMLVRAYRDQGR